MASSLFSLSDDDTDASPSPNWLYLAGLAGSMLTKQPGSGPTLAERMLPTYMQQQERADLLRQRQALGAQEAKEYQFLEQGLQDSLQRANGDPRMAVQNYSKWLQSATLRSPEVARAAFMAVDKLKDRALQADKQQRRRSAYMGLWGKIPDGQRMTRGQAMGQLALTGEFDPEEMSKIVAQLPEDYTVHNNNGILTAVDNKTGAVTQLGSSLQQATQNQPAQVVTRDERGWSSAPVTGSMFERTQGGLTGQVGEGGNIGTIASTPGAMKFDNFTTTGAGLLGADLRELEAAANSGDPRARARASGELRLYSQVGLLASKVGEETVLRALKEGTLDKLLPGFGSGGLDMGAASQAASGVISGKQQDALNYANAQGADASGRAINQALAIEQGRRDIEANDPYREPGRVFYNRETEEPTRLTKEQARTILSQPDGPITDISTQEDQLISLIKGAVPLFPAAKDLAQRILSAAQGGNLARGTELTFQKWLGSADAAQFRQLIGQLNIEGARILGGSSRPPVALMRLLEQGMPTNYATIQQAHRELSTLETDLKNRVRVLLKKPALPIDIGSKFTTSSGKGFK